jgi:hypothetical protein
MAIEASCLPAGRQGFWNLKLGIFARVMHRLSSSTGETDGRESFIGTRMMQDELVKRSIIYRQMTVSPHIPLFPHRPSNLPFLSGNSCAMTRIPYVTFPVGDPCHQVFEKSLIFPQQ